MLSRSLLDALSLSLHSLLEHLTSACLRATSEGPALGSFVDSRHSRSGWGILHVASDARWTDEQQMFGAGFLEGWLTAGVQHLVLSRAGCDAAMRNAWCGCGCITKQNPSWSNPAAMRKSGLKAAVERMLLGEDVASRLQCQIAEHSAG